MQTSTGISRHIAAYAFFHIQVYSSTESQLAVFGMVTPTGLGKYPCAMDEGARLRLRIGDRQHARVVSQALHFETGALEGVHQPRGIQAGGLSGGQNGPLGI